MEGATGRRLLVTIGDYHVHTSFSIDCNEPMENQCRAAIAAGITEIAFTEHVDHDSCDEESREKYDYAGYSAEIDRCRELFGDQLTILKAAEVDWNCSIATDVEAFLAKHRFDFIIGSVHNLDHRYVGFDTLESFGGPRRMYDDYLDQVEGMVLTGFPCVVGHCDLPRRYHHVSPLEAEPFHFEERLRHIFRLAAERGVGFEVNTSGLRRGNGVTFPEPAVIAWFVEEGGEVVTIGSDSHKAADTGHSIIEIERQLAELGIDWRYSWAHGHAERVPLASVAR